MRQLKLLAAVALIGGTAVACTYDSRTAYEPGYRTQYVMAPTYTTGYVAYSDGYTTQYVTAPTYYSNSAYSRSSDVDQDGIPNWRDRRPSNPYRY